jgi:hypothetical protein
LAVDVINVFENAESSISSSSKNMKSNQVLLELAPALTSLQFRVESGRKNLEKVEVPVLYGRRGKPDKSFCVDAHQKEQGFVVEVEAGSAVDGGQVLKDFFEACTMDGVSYLCIAVRQTYGKNKGKNFEHVVKYFEALPRVNSCCIKAVFSRVADFSFSDALLIAASARVRMLAIPSCSCDSGKAPNIKCASRRVNPGTPVAAFSRPRFRKLKRQYR